MTYELITQFNSPNYYPAAVVPAKYGQARVVRGITIHWWGLPSTSPAFAGVVAYLCRSGGTTSAHYVVEAGRAACIVDPDNAAWHAGNSTGNATTIGIECNPLCRDGDYQTVGELVRDLRAAYGDVPLYRHSDWKNTACPGTYDLGRINSIAYSTPAPPAPDPEEDDMQLVLAKLKTAPAVWIGDGLTRRLIPNNAELADITWQLNHGVLKGSPTVLEVDSLEWLGKAI